MSEPVLWAAEELSLAIGRQTLYDNAEFFINAGERVGLIGRNGSGKSTLLRLITGEELPGSGNLTRARNLRVAVLPQDFEIDNGRSIADNVRDGLAWFLELQKKFETVSVNSPEHAEIDHLLMLHDGWNLDTKVEQVLAKLGLSDPQRPCDKLSGGENAGSRWRGRSSPNPICCCWTNRPTISTSRRWSGLKSSSPNTAAAVFS